LSRKSEAEAVNDTMTNAGQASATTSEILGAADIADILRALPHRYPFVMIDRVQDMRGDAFGVGIKNVTFNEPQFTGHFPGRPVFPGVLMIEGMAQTAGVIVIRSGLAQSTTDVFFLTIDKAKFRRLVVPGDTLEYHMTKINQRRTMWWYRGEAKVRGQVVAEAEVGAMISAG
jgi:3-hydroxyacyl-[acyl-carrier-protein] dehydratase